MLATPDQQISLTDPDARSMATSGPLFGRCRDLCAAERRHYLLREPVQLFQLLDERGAERGDLIERSGLQGLSAGGNRIRTIGSAGEGSDASCVCSLSLRLFGWRRTYQRRHRKIGRVHAGPMVRILFPPAWSLVRT